MNGKDPIELPYRPCVGIMLLNKDGLVWVGRRIMTTNSEGLDQERLWQMPQGGIDKGEDPLKAALRELYEETGISNVTLLAEAPDWIKYDFPADLIGNRLRNKYRGQTQKWFAFRFEGLDTEITINPPPAGHRPEFDDWDWKPMAELPLIIVPFKQKAYEEVVAAFSNLSV